MNPRVLHIVPQLFGRGGIYGGGERYAWELSRAMAVRVPTRLVGFNAGFGPGYGSGLGAARDQVHWQRSGDLTAFVLRNSLPGARFASSPAGFGLLRHLRWAEVIHCHQTHTLGADLALFYARLSGKPIFGTDHGGGGFCFRRGPDPDAAFTARLFVSRFSQQVATDPASSAVILGGVDTGRFCPDPANPPRQDEVLYVGRLLPHKGIAVLLRAASFAATPLAVVGRATHDAYWNTLQALARESLAPVRFVTDAEDEQVIRHYQRALCAVLPSVYHTVEGFFPAAELLGQTLLEAMACATPVIASAVGGMPEVVVEGVTGFVVPANDPAALAAKIAWFRQHPEQARRMGEAARAHVLARFQWDAVVDRCLAAYRRYLPANSG